MALKLGKLPPKPLKPRLSLGMYVDRAVLPSPPERIAYSTAATQPWGVMLNDQIGDCTCATIGHLVQTWTANAGQEVTIPDQAILKAYSDVSGYSPRKPWTDQGAVIQEVLEYTRKHGVGGHKIGAFAEIDLQDVWMVEVALHLFGGVDIGFAVSQRAMDEFQNGDRLWEVSDENDGGIIGGHSVAVIDYTPQGLVCVTWGTLQTMTWAFIRKYADEMWALLSEDFLRNGVAPNGFNLTQLTADLASVTK